MSESEPGGLAVRFRTDRRWQLAALAGGLVLVLGITLAVVVPRKSEAGGIADGPLAKAPASADRIPADQIIRKVPRNCGVSEGTAARLAPGADPDAEKGGVFRRGGPGSCMWYSLDDGKAKCGFCMGDFRNERVLTVGISLAEGRRQSPVSEAMQLVDGGGRGSAAGSDPPKIVEGLGEEAIARYSAETDTEGATVDFREGNAVVTVSYKGWDAARGGRKTISEKTALDGAFAAAAETAKSMGTEARPVLSAVKNPVTPPLSRVPKPCDAVSGGTVDKVARGAYRRRASSILFSTVTMPGVSVDACAWKARTSQYSGKGRSRTLTVSLAVAQERLPGLGTFTATRSYQGIYRNQRAGKVPGIADFTGFRPLAGPGDRAFTATKAARGPSVGEVAVVVFQKRNVLVEVAYQGADGRTDLRGSRLVDSAYTVAVEVERSLRS